MSLFSRNSNLPGIHGTLRDATPQGKGLKKVVAGDIVVVDSTDLSRQQAQALADVAPAVVINKGSFSSGQVPNFGPSLLLDAGVTLIDAVGAGFTAKEGKPVRVTDDGAVYAGEKLCGQGTVLTADGAQKAYAEARQYLDDRLEAYFGNTIEFVHSEGPLLIDGFGVPDPGVEMHGKKVLVVSPSDDHREKIKLLRNFIREYTPVLIGVDAAADSLMDMGYTPDIVIGDPSAITSETLRSGAKVVVPATPEGHAEGLQRIQDLGVSAVTFPSAFESASDLALLLVNFHGAGLIVQVGGSLDLDDMFIAAEHATPAAFLARLKAGRALVDADSVISLYTAPSTGLMPWLWALMGILVALAVIILVAGFGGDAGFVENLQSTLHNIAELVKGWSN